MPPAAMDYLKELVMENPSGYMDEYAYHLEVAWRHRWSASTIQRAIKVGNGRCIAVADECLNLGCLSSETGLSS
jgi:hypothetical protein